MVINPPDQRKTAISSLPRINQPQALPQGRADSALPRFANQTGPTQHDLLQKNVEKLVGQTFFGTLLKQMHESPFKSDLFSGGRGEEAFQPIYDQTLSQHMTRGAGAKIVRPIVKRLEKRAKQAYEKQKGGDYVSAYRRA